MDNDQFDSIWKPRLGADGAAELRRFRRILIAGAFSPWAALGGGALIAVGGVGAGAAVATRLGLISGTAGDAATALGIPVGAVGLLGDSAGALNDFLGTIPCD